MRLLRKSPSVLEPPPTFYSANHGPEACEEAGEEDAASSECDGSSQELGSHRALARVRCLWCVGCTVFCMAFLAVAGVALNYSINLAAKRAIATQGETLFGTNVSVGHVSLGLLSARWTIGNVTVASPQNFSKDFLTLGSAALVSRDLSLRGGFRNIPELQKLRFTGLHMYVDQRANGDSNAKEIANHMRAMANASSDGPYSLSRKVKIALLELADITATVCIHPVCNAGAPKVSVIKRIRVKNIGTRGGGVHVYDLATIILHAILSSVVHSTPALLGNLGHLLHKNLDYEHLIVNLGKGLAGTGDKIHRLINTTEDSVGHLLAGALGRPTSMTDRVMGHIVDHTTRLQHAFVDAASDPDDS